MVVTKGYVDGSERVTDIQEKQCCSGQCPIGNVRLDRVLVCMTTWMALAAITHRKSLSEIVNTHLHDGSSTDF